MDTQLIADKTYYIAEAEGQVVGCGGWSKRKTLYGGDQMKAEQDPLLDPKEDAGRIRAFFIHPNWARKGIGRRIIEACEEAAKADGFTKMELGATLPGEPLYAALGYEVTDRFEIPMGDRNYASLRAYEKTIELKRLHEFTTTGHISPFGAWSDW